MYTVKQARQFANLTQAQVAKKMGVNVDTYRRIELNPECASIQNARKFCKIVGRTMDEIFFDVDSTDSRIYI